MAFEAERVWQERILVDLADVGVVGLCWWRNGWLNSTSGHTSALWSFTLSHWQWQILRWETGGSDWPLCGCVCLAFLLCDFGKDSIMFGGGWFQVYVNPTLIDFVCFFELNLSTLPSFPNSSLFMLSTLFHAPFCKWGVVSGSAMAYVCHHGDVEVRKKYPWGELWVWMGEVWLFFQL